MAARRGVTLVEMLVVVGLLGMLSATVVSGLSAGLRVWERLKTRGIQEEWVLLALQQFRQDIRNARPDALLPFKGSYDALTLPGVVAADDSSAEAAPEELGAIRYALRSGRLCRSTVAYRRLDGPEPACRTIVPHVQRVELRYLEVSPASGETVWHTSWEDARPPWAVRLELTVQPPGGPRQTRQVTVPLPVAPGWGEPPSS